MVGALQAPHGALARVDQARAAVPAGVRERARQPVVARDHEDVARRDEGAALGAARRRGPRRSSRRRTAPRAPRPDLGVQKRLRRQLRGALQRRQGALHRSPIECQLAHVGRLRAMAEDTLSITDNRTGKTYEVADHRRHHQGDGPAADQGQRGRLRDDGLRPGLHQHRVVPFGDHLHRRRRGRTRVPRLPDRAAVRAVELPRGRLPAHQRRAARRRPSSTSGCTRSPSTRSCTRTSRASCRASATTRTRWGCCSRRTGALSTFYPEASKIKDDGDPRHADHPAAGQGPDARRVRLPPHAWASPTCIRTTTSATPATSSR